MSRMSLPSLAVKYRPIIYSTVLLAMAWGIVTYFSMPRREDPEFTIRTCVISTSWPGASAETIEELITDKIEQSVTSIEEVDITRSTTLTGQSTVFVDLEDDVSTAEIQNVWDKVRARVELVQMPADNIRPIVNDEFGDTTVLLLAVHQVPSNGRPAVRKEDEYTPRQLEEFAEDIQDSLRLLPGVAKVDMFGQRDEAVYIETDLGNWAQLDLTTSQLEALAKERNVIAAGGELDTESGHFTVSADNEFDAVKEIMQIASTVKAKNGNNRVALTELGLTVKRDYEDPPSYLCRVTDSSMSNQAVMLGITMKSDTNIIDVCEAAKERIFEMTEVEQRFPPDIAVTAISDQSISVAKKIQDVVINVIEAILIVVVVVYLVVGLRTSFVMAANIPVVVIITIGLISLFGVQLEQISLAALIISLGLLVDNAVQVCDQARTNQMAGMKPFPAAIDGANTLAIPMLVGTLTTMAAFLPMLFSLEGGGKEYVYSLPVTVSTTLALSWVLAMTLCVVLAGLFIRAPNENESGSPVIALLKRLRPLFKRSKKSKLADDTKAGENFVFKQYGLIAMIAIKAKWFTALATFAMMIGIMSLPVSSEFFPEADGTQFAIKVMLPQTASIAQTDAVAKQVESIIQRLGSENTDQPRLQTMRTLVGGGGARWHLSWNPEPRTRSYAEILVRTTNGAVTKEYAQRIRDVCERGDEQLGIDPIVGARIVPVRLSLGPPADPLVFRVMGNGFADPDVLRGAANKLKAIVSEQQETWDVNDSWGIDGLQVRVDVDENLAVLAGVTNSQVARTLNSYFSGLRLTTFREGDHQVPVYFRLNSDERESIRGLRDAFVEGDNGKIPLESIATLKQTFEIAKIARRNMNRSIEVSAQMEPGVTGNDVVKRVLALKEFKDLQASLPVGYWIEPGGSFEESADAGGQMMMSFVASFVLIVLCLIFQYNGWAKPLLILSTLPLALVGAWLGLFLFDMSLGFMPQLGILALFGIVLNTAIIFVEFADIVIAEKSKKRLAEGVANGPISGLTIAEFRDCLIEAGKQRMLPIFLTTATTVGGLIPLALSGGPLFEGLAYCMIVGLLLTTTMTLIVVPAFYAILVENFGVSPIPKIEEQPE